MRVLNVKTCTCFWGEKCSLKGNLALRELSGHEIEITSACLAINGHGERNAVLKKSNLKRPAFIRTLCMPCSQNLFERKLRFDRKLLLEAVCCKELEVRNRLSLFLRVNMRCLDLRTTLKTIISGSSEKNESLGTILVNYQIVLKRTERF